MLLRDCLDFIAGAVHCADRLSVWPSACAGYGDGEPHQYGFVCAGAGVCCAGRQDVQLAQYGWLALAAAGVVLGSGLLAWPWRGYWALPR